ncbi:MAG TPA: hypothetical protein VHS05_02095 [Pyrinomonadaceae bacterium]|jgi:hypothetical protein|nr:hypothetical protein [Pyrinomonadaceae bacterium]
MKNFVAAVLLLILSGIPMTHTTILVGGTAPRPRLQLTTSIVREMSCSSNHLSLELRFTFKNDGAEPVIIDKRSFVTRSLISESLKAAVAKKYEAQTRADLFDDIFPASPKDISNFAVVRPGETYDLQTEQTRVTLLINDRTPHSKEYLRPGNYFLQIEIAMWTYLNEPEQFRQKWKNIGVLWSEGLTSQPMPFVVEQNRPISKCS